MRLECPECDARIHVPTPKDGARVTCPRCKARFHPPEDDADEADVAPRRSSCGSRRSQRESAAFPVVLALGGGLLVILLIGVAAVALAFSIANEAGDEPEVAANDPGAAAPALVVADQSKEKPAPRPAPKLDPAPEPKPAPMPPPSTVKQTEPPPKSAPLPAKRAEPKVTRPRPVPPVSRPTPRIFPAPAITGPYAALFREKVTSLPPTIRAAKLLPADPDIQPEIPTFYSLMMARKGSSSASRPAPAKAKLTLEEVKRACAFIKVDAGESSSTGSGFLIASTGPAGLIATNFHVIEAAASPGYGSRSAKISTVFSSGLPDEKILTAEVIAFDEAADLAILKAESTTPWPKPINPYNAPPKLVEGTAIQFWGFPLGEILASGRKNPEITLGTGTVSSLRHTPSGKLDRVQISGTMNPGNSGGPLVDTDGRLVGVAVSIINPKIGTGIGFAVPVEDLIALLEGKVLDSLFIPVELEQGMARFLVAVPIMDPMDRIETVYIRRWAGSGKPPSIVKDRYTGYKPYGLRRDGRGNLPGAQEFPLKKFLTDSDMASSLGIALGEITVPLDTENVMLQLASQTSVNPQTGNRLTAASKPIPYKVSVADMPVGTDARPFTELTQNPDSLEGKVVVVRGRVLSPPVTREPVQDLVIADDGGKRPERMRFLVDAEQAAQFDEVEFEHQPLPVRLVCLVGKRGVDGFVPVRVARLDFIGRGNRIVRTIPDPAAEPDTLAALNRDPGKFAGKTLEMKVSAVPITPRIKTSNEFKIVFSNHRAPRNLSFVISSSMKSKLLETLGDDLRVNMIVRSRVTAAVPPQAAPPGSRTTVTLTKVEFLSADGEVVKSIE